ncbi:MAG: peptidase M56, partial [Clostridia bacterium]|nr:peptidase M56 [Clostridia bacterium]
MLDTVFLQIYDMSRVAGLVILIVMLIRLCLKRAPKVFSYALWAIVLFRLLCPVSIEAPVSLIPQTEPSIASYDLLNESVTPLSAMDAAQQAVGDVLNGGIGIQHVKTTELEEDGTQRILSTDWHNVWMLFTKHVWLFGMAALLVYSTVSLVRLKRRLLCSVCLRDNIYLADDIDSPFVMGLIRPRIYLPSSLPEQERDYIILHEQHHIRRGDHVVKLLSFAALCLHCFHPLVWAAFILSGKDMEMSCDEAVLGKLGEDIRADYSASLISLATGRRIIAGTPLAFGEGNTEGRIRNIARWKKPAVWVIAVAGIVCTAAVVCLMTNPMSRDTMLMGAEYRVEEILYRTSEEYDYVDNDSPSICITADYCFYAQGT